MRYADEDTAPQSNALMLGQNHSEAILRAHLQRLDCEVEFGTALHSIQPGSDHVWAHVIKKDGDHGSVETIKCRWLVGTDGARGEQRNMTDHYLDPWAHEHRCCS